jgi:hypothetical protein
MYSQYFQDRMEQLVSAACILDTTPPTFAGITGLVANANGSLTASWTAATDSASPIRYEIYIQALTATGLFVDGNVGNITYQTSHTIFIDAFDAELVAGITYYVGIRAIDAVGNENTSTVSMSAVSTGVPATSILNAIAGIWDQVRSSHAGALTFGGALQSKVDVDVSTRASAAAVAAIPTTPLLTSDSRLNTLDANISSRAPASTAVSTADLTPTRAAKLDNLDVAVSTRLSTAGYTAPDNTSISAIKSKTDNLPAVPAAQSDVTTVGTAVGGVQTTANAIKVKTDQMLFDGSSFIKANAVVTIDDPDIAAIKAKTDLLTFDGSSYVNAHTKTNDDKTGYALTSAEETAIAVAVWAAIRASNTSGGSFGEALQGIISATRAGYIDQIPTTASQTTAAALASAIWDELQASKTVSGSFGAALQGNIGALIAAIKTKTDQLLFDVDTGVVAHTINIPAVDVQSIVNGVLDEQTSLHQVPGSVGKKIVDGSTGGSGGGSEEIILVPEETDSVVVVAEDPENIILVEETA